MGQEFGLSFQACPRSTMADVIWMAGDSWNGSTGMCISGHVGAILAHVASAETRMSKMTNSPPCLVSGLRWPKHLGVDQHRFFSTWPGWGFFTVWWSQDTQPSSYMIADFPQSKCPKRPRWTLQSLLEPSFGSHTESLLVRSMSYTGLAQFHCGMRQLKGIDTRKWGSWGWDIFRDSLSQRL